MQTKTYTHNSIVSNNPPKGNNPDVYHMNDKHMVHLYNGLLFNHKKEVLILAIAWDSEGIYPQWKKPVYGRYPEQINS